MAHGRPDFTYLADTDIIAQTIGNVAIDIAAQTLSEMAVNITAQDLAQLVIKIAAQTVGVYLQPEWAALQGVDKNLAGLDASAIYGEALNVDYTVTAGKTLYITGVTCFIYALAAADYDHFLYVVLNIINTTTTVVLGRLGGIGGCGIMYDKPLVILAGQVLRAQAINFSNITCVLGLTAWGYEI